LKATRRWRKHVAMGKPVTTTKSGHAGDLDTVMRTAAALVGAGRLAEAEAQIRKLRKRDPAFAPAAHLLGVIAGRAGRIDESITLLEEAVSLDPRSVPSRNELAALLRLAGRFDESVAQAREAVTLAPDDAGSHNNLGVSLLATNRCEEAVAAIERAAALAPGSVTYRCNLAVALWKIGERDKARAALRQAAVIETTPAGRLRIARLMREQGASSDAERLLRLAIAANPSDPTACDLLGTLLRELGRFEDAAALYRKRIAAGDAGAHLGLVLTRRMTELDRPALEEMTRLTDVSGVSERDRARLHYAIAKTEDDLGAYADAITHYDAANRIQSDALERSGRKLDKARHAANIDRMIALFDREFLSRQRKTGSDSDRPVFIVGMIRSGTTLAEQILSSHPAVGAGGELPFWGKQGTLLAEMEAGRFDAARTRELADAYGSFLARLAPDASRVTDKMPTNYLLLGLIHAAFPRARIVHCRRDPRDTCLSIYVTPFDDLPDFAGDRGSIAFYYKQYARLMRHWHSVLPPESIFELDYEALVADREAMIRRLVAFTGLEWNDACLRPEQNPRAVATPSMWQVRQPVYRASAGRWRHYANWLGEFAHLSPEG
jgi:tetratricopeptide (TPR) repeat protein